MQGKYKIFIAYALKTSDVVCFLPGNSPASEFYVPTFRYLPAYEDGQAEGSETSAYKIQTSGITQKKAYNVENTAKV